jgi:hypothetical protein
LIDLNANGHAGAVAGFLAGYVTHLTLDSCTRGIPLI